MYALKTSLSTPRLRDQDLHSDNYMTLDAHPIIGLQRTVSESSKTDCSHYLHAQSSDLDYLDLNKNMHKPMKHVKGH